MLFEIFAWSRKNSREARPDRRRTRSWRGGIPGPQEKLVQDVHFLGKQDFVYATSRKRIVFVALGHRSFGLAALEAMACEVPALPRT